MTLRRQNGTFELSLSLFAWIVVLLGVTVWVVIPETKTFLRLQDAGDATVQKTVRLQAEYDGLYAQKEATEADAAALAEQRESRADAASVQAWLGTVWQGATVVDGNAQGAFKVQAATATPAEFYRFVDRLDAAPWVLRVETPITMRSDGSRVTVTFMLRAATQAVATSPSQN